MGPPGAGKGTHATSVADRFGIPTISTGDMFRAEIASGSDLGNQVNAIVSTGGLVPDELTNQVVAARLAKADAANGWLLDGYPRTLEQVQALDELLAGRGVALDWVILLDVPREEVIKRLIKRATIEGRADDTPEIIDHRQSLYEAQTAPLIAAYDKRGLVIHADASGSIEESNIQVHLGLDAVGLPGQRPIY